MKRPLLLTVLCLAAAHCAVAAEPVPKPRLRPAAPAATAGPATPVPRPQLRPDETAAEPAPPAASPDLAARGGWPADAVAAGRAACASLLTGLDIAYTPADPIGEPGGCGAAAPIEISAVAGVRLTPPATETCAMGAALAQWVTEGVQPAARTRLGTAVTEIRTATSYACRRRNNGSTGKMSEHSKANALDMSGFTFARARGVTVGGPDHWGAGLSGANGPSEGGSFLEDVRRAACSHFTTVLGPGSDPYHGDHFHVDVLQRKGGYRICQ